ncbi:MAG: metallophosphoesterase family protein [Candidatus Brocadiia bacterium]
MNTLRYAIIGDIHSNLTALETVKADIHDMEIDEILCVGDLVGYAARPRECLEFVRENAAAVVAGNHDYGVSGALSLEYFNADAMNAVQWTREVLSEEEISYLDSLPLITEYNDILLVHSTPRNPEAFAYIQTLYDATIAFNQMENNLALIGHSHAPIVFQDSDPPDYFLVNEFELPEGQKVLINVGSVGQPRDLDPRSSYAIYDSEERRVTLRRLEYNIEQAARRITEAGLPPNNAQRLYWGQ